MSVHLLDTVLEFVTGPTVLVATSVLFAASYGENMDLSVPHWHAKLTNKTSSMLR